MRAVHAMLLALLPIAAGAPTHVATCATWCTDFFCNMEHCKACGVCLAKVEVENKAHGADPKSLKDLSPPSSPDSLALLKSGKAHALPEPISMAALYALPPADRPGAGCCCSRHEEGSIRCLEGLCIGEGKMSCVECGVHKEGNGKALDKTMGCLYCRSERPKACRIGVGIPAAEDHSPCEHWCVREHGHCATETGSCGGCAVCNEVALEDTSSYDCAHWCDKDSGHCSSERHCRGCAFCK
mmetsp:Transcript_21826/g.46140  ORF Transcript_21826/g.46140 Transcript_21826/m.46140 type:complete len:241 (+) Transcript_21826:245-967(+)